MTASGETLCITCGQTAGDPPQLNHLASGEVCPACHARFLDSQPPLLPGFQHAPAEASEAPEVEEAEEEAEVARPSHLKLVGKQGRPAVENEG